jgi:replicative DNA helicase
VKHLKYQYIPKECEEYKLIFRSIVNQFELSQGKLPSYGIISQQHQSNRDVQNALDKIKKADVVDQELAIKQLDRFIRDMKLQVIMLDVIDNFNADKKDEAMKILAEGAEDLVNFSLRQDTSQFLKVFADFHSQMKSRQADKDIGDDMKEKVPFGIDILDIISDGGMDPGELAMIIMQSGKGKSTFLKNVGMNACRLGYDVLHIQLEGSKREAYDKYAQLWTGCTYKEVRWGEIPKDKEVKLDKVISNYAKRMRDIEIFAFEKYGSASMRDIREIVMEYQKMHGFFPQLLIIDSLDLCITGDNKKVDFDPEYTKHRLQGVAQRMKDLAVELFPMRILTATQTSDISKEKWNNPDWVITRENTEGDRTLVKPFSTVITGNQTMDERKKKIIRLHIDKLRYYDVKDQTYPIYSDYAVGKFYDKARTMREFGKMYEDR